MVESSDVVLITGGAGYVGSHINKCLNDCGYRTVVLDNLERGYRDLVQWGEFIQGNAGDEELLKDIFHQYPITDVIHLAAYAYVGESVERPLAYWDNNFCESLRLLQQCAMSGVKRVIFSSTCSTYGIPSYVPIEEEHQQNPINPYGSSKLSVEWLLKDLSLVENLEYCCLRYFNAAGADPSGRIGERHRPETHLIPIALRAAFDGGENIDIYGVDYDTPDGTCIRDYIHVNDIADAHVGALQTLANGGSSEVCNLGLGRGFSVCEVIESVCRVTGQPIKGTPKPRRVGDPAVLVADGSRAKQIFGWEPKYTDLDRIVETAWSWHQKDWHE